MRSTWMGAAVAAGVMLCGWMNVGGAEASTVTFNGSGFDAQDDSSVFTLSFDTTSLVGSLDYAIYPFDPFFPTFTGSESPITVTSSLDYYFDSQDFGGSVSGGSLSLTYNYSSFPGGEFTLIGTQFRLTYVSVDGDILAPVPLPHSAALFGLALITLGAGFYRKRQSPVEITR